MINNSHTTCIDANGRRVIVSTMTVPPGIDYRATQTLALLNNPPPPKPTRTPERLPGCPCHYCAPTPTEIAATPVMEWTDATLPAEAIQPKFAEPGSFPHGENQFAADVANELARARAKHPKPINSAHEGYAVLLEEVREVEAEVFRGERNPSALLAELIQVAAMAQRMAEDIGLAESAIARQRKI